MQGRRRRERTDEDDARSHVGGGRVRAGMLVHATASEEPSFQLAPAK